MVEITCNGKNRDDCYECNKYWSSHSLHYCTVEHKKISTITCSIGGDRIFDEDGNWINQQLTKPGNGQREPNGKTKDKSTCIK